MNSKRKSYEIQKLFPAVGYSGPIYLSFPIRHFLTKKYCRMPKSFLRSEATASNLMLLGSQYPFIRLEAHGTFNTVHLIMTSLSIQRLCLLQTKTMTDA
jgi:hypothetical protein